MAENKRFTWKTVYGWEKSAFLEVMNGLDKKNQQLKKENEQLKQTLQEVYNDDYYLKEFIIAIINVYSKNRGVSPIRLEMIWDSSDMDKTSLKHLKSSFHK